MAIYKIIFLFWQADFKIDIASRRETSSLFSNEILSAMGQQLRGVRGRILHNGLEKFGRTKLVHEATVAVII